MNINIYALTLQLFVSTAMSMENGSPVKVEELSITVRDGSREAGYTNKNAGHFYTLTGDLHASGWMGWTVMDTHLLDDYELIINGTNLLRKRRDAVAEVLPHQLIRRYPGGVVETFTLLDSVNVIIVELSVPEEIVEPSFRPRFSSSLNRSDYRFDRTGSVVTVVRENSVDSPGPAGFPAWLAITAEPAYTVHILESDESQDKRTDAYEARTVAPLELRIEPGGRSSSFRFVMAADTNRQSAVDLAAQVLADAAGFIERRKVRMQNLLSDSWIHTEHPEFNKALAWARLSMDALVMDQTGPGIYAGLPWFNNYWGRDTFISFSGALLITGAFHEARDVLRSFAEYQDKDPDSPTFGRIPNRITTQSVIYNTTDGTPWFIRELYEYYRYTGDDELIAELYPVAVRSIEGALKYHTDEHYFMTHGDAETWMDAVGPDGPWSPRGNRAVEIQYLWYRQLKVGAELARLTGDTERADAWTQIADTLADNFNRQFVNMQDRIVYDHLNRDGSPDRRVRPNQIFAFELVRDEETRREMLRTVLGEMTFPWGVASLSPADTNFHPYHHYAPYYVQDAAYHNGIVWTWLIGRVISASVQYGLQDLVFEVTANMIRQILDRGAAGTFSELLDAFPREGETEPRLSGTFTQAWNLAEFLRTAYQDYLGLYPDISLQILSLRPSLPVALGMVESSIPFGSDRIRITLRRDDEKAEVVLTPEILTERLAIKLVFGPAGKDPFEIETVLTPGDPVTIYIGADSVSVRRSDIPMSVESRQLTGSRERFSLNNASLAVPEWRDYWTSLKQPEYVMLPHSAVKQSPGENAIVLYDREDPVFDDSGPHGTYTYPTNPHFRDGILDIVRFTVKYDEENCYFSLRFRNLHDPGYHPEYGFQLTYAVVLIDRGTGEGGMGDAGANSFYLLTAEGGNFDRAVYVGGGIRVTDDGGNILSEYRPAPEDIVDPLGDIVEKEIRFSLPNEYLGRPSTVWRFLVLVGAQDDHGGAGIGVFRNIERTGGEWHGGGKMNPQDPNVYDTILPD